jgi:hypothetical protein
MLATLPGATPDVGVKRVGVVEHAAADADRLKAPAGFKVVEGARRDAETIGGLLTGEEHTVAGFSESVQILSKCTNLLAEAVYESAQLVGKRRLRPLVRVAESIPFS